MNEKVLVTYASKYGATKEIAEKIGAELEQAGVQVELFPADRNVDPTPYKAVIIGAALYVGKWHKAAEAFVKSQEQRLTGKPVWIFSSGPSGEGNPLEL